MCRPKAHDRPASGQQAAGSGGSGASRASSRLGVSLQIKPLNCQKLLMRSCAASQGSTAARRGSQLSSRAQKRCAASTVASRHMLRYVCRSERRRRWALHHPPPPTAAATARDLSRSSTITQAASTKSRQQSKRGGSMALPRLVAFDLDATLWGAPLPPPNQCCRWLGKESVLPVPGIQPVVHLIG